MVGMQAQREVDTLRDFAVATATAAAALVREERARIENADGLGAHTTTKSSAVDPVTEVDQASEAFIVSAIRETFPGDGILGEEGTDFPSTTGVTWVIDPIDGTVNFLYGARDYAVSIGAFSAGHLVAGAVVNVAQGIVYAAAAGHGATVRHLGQEPRELRCNRVYDPALALVATGFSYDARRRRQQGAVLAELLPQVRDIRRVGAAALDLCRVAEGSVDAYFEHGINAWDFAAGAVIAAEAGAVVHHPGLDKGAANGEIIWVAAPDLAPAFEQLLASIGALEPQRG